MSVQLRNVLQCPACGFKVTEQMPFKRKVMVYTCAACNVTTTANDHECCIFCKIGRLKCPQKQEVGGS